MTAAREEGAIKSTFRRRETLTPLRPTKAQHAAQHSDQEGKRNVPICIEDINIIGCQLQKLYRKEAVSNAMPRPAMQNLLRNAALQNYQGSRTSPSVSKRSKGCSVAMLVSCANLRSAIFLSRHRVHQTAVLVGLRARSKSISDSINAKKRWYGGYLR